MSIPALTLTLPWPARELHPNARPHYHAKAKAAKAYREGAFWLTTSRDLWVPEEGEITISIMFHPPDKRRRDLDGMLAAIKNGLDGIADALGCDDQRFALNIRRGEPRKGGEIAVEINAPTVADTVAAQDHQQAEAA